MLLDFRRAKREWPPRFLPGHWALGLQKLPLVRFHTCAWVSRTNAPGTYAVGPVRDRPLRRPLGLAVVTVFPPFGGVCVDIVPDAEIVRLAADDVVVVGRLPKIEPRKLISKSF